MLMSSWMRADPDASQAERDEAKKYEDAYGNIPSFMPVPELDKIYQEAKAAGDQAGYNQDQQTKDVDKGKETLGNTKEPGAEGGGTKTSDELFDAAAPALKVFETFGSLLAKLPDDCRGSTRALDLDKDIRSRFDEQRGIQFQDFVDDAAHFKTGATTVEKTLHESDSQLKSLFGTWTGDGAKAASDHYNEKIQPKADELVKTLNEASRATLDTANAVFKLCKGKADEVAELYTDVVGKADFAMAQKVVAIATGEKSGVEDLAQIAGWMDVNFGSNLVEQLNSQDGCCDDDEYKKAGQNLAKQWIQNQFNPEMWDRIYLDFDKSCKETKEFVDKAYDELDKVMGKIKNEFEGADKPPGDGAGTGGGPGPGGTGGGPGAPGTEWGPDTTGGSGSGGPGNSGPGSGGPDFSGGGTGGAGAGGGPGSGGGSGSGGPGGTDGGPRGGSGGGPIPSIPDGSVPSGTSADGGGSGSGSGSGSGKGSPGPVPPPPGGSPGDQEAAAEDARKQQAAAQAEAAKKAAAEALKNGPSGGGGSSLGGGGSSPGGGLGGGSGPGGGDAGSQADAKEAADKAAAEKAAEDAKQKAREALEKLDGPGETGDKLGGDGPGGEPGEDKPGKDDEKLDTLEVKQGDKTFEMTEPDKNGEMEIKVGDGSGPDKEFKLDWTDDGKPGEEGVHRPGPDGKIHIEDGDLKITAERPDGPDGPTVVTVDDGSGKPTSYTLGEEDSAKDKDKPDAPADKPEPKPGPDREAFRSDGPTPHSGGGGGSASPAGVEGASAAPSSEPSLLGGTQTTSGVQPAQPAAAPFAQPTQMTGTTGQPMGGAMAPMGAMGGMGAGNQNSGDQERGNRAYQIEAQLFETASAPGARITGSLLDDEDVPLNRGRNA
ncbi:WXG100 family type VII secretion target [Amycolatopsis suaedae]|uniref:WXG100 family type VII secretion target n=2 Tax=Amycolatopsis suaedae TaxID=2510978 RepID=A0A4Q7J522_9PSEU|nr:WXG100 family type VII secretion target [Amycolatopsis suaedae]